MGNAPVTPNAVSAYTPTTWERGLSAGAAITVVCLVSYLVIRNQPFSDPNLVVFVRILLSFATALLGATIPGTMNVTWKGKGFAIRATSAIGLFVLTYFFTPRIAAPPQHPQSSTGFQSQPPQVQLQQQPERKTKIGMGFDNSELGIHVSPNDRAEFSPYKIYYGSYIDADGNEEVSFDATPEIKEAAAKTAQWIAGFGDSIKCVMIVAGIDAHFSEEYSFPLAQRLGDTAKEQLIANGINGDYIITLSYGKDRANPLFFANNQGKLARNYNNYASIAVVFK
jgi:hypothetical protein